MIKITCLGNTGFDINQKKGLGFLIEINDFKILLDCGVYTVQALHNYGFKASDINLVFISHEHVDHILGLPWLLNSISFEEYYSINNNQNNKYFLIPNKNSYFKKYIDENFSWMFTNDKIQFIYHTEKNIFNFNNIKFETFEIQHGIMNYGVSISHNNQKIIYISDFDVLQTKNINNIIKEADIGIFSIFGSSKYKKEAKQYGFSTAKDISNLCKESEIKHIWFYHNFYESDIVNINKEIEKYYGNSFNIVKPYEELILS